MPAKRPRFFEKTYEGRLFAGIVTANGPYVLDIASNCGTAVKDGVKPGQRGGVKVGQ